MRGHLDALLTSGHVEGWAFDDGHPWTGLPVHVVHEGEVVADGVACRFRDDLAAADVGTGWHAFRLTLRAWPPLRPARPVLTLRASKHVLWAGDVGWVDAPQLRHTSVQELIAHDPTQVADPAGLRAMRPHLDALRGRLGDAAFVRRCYLVLLGRPADPSGLTAYGEGLAAGHLDAFTMVAAIMRSAEFRSAGRSVQAPTLAAFPFAPGE